MSFKTKKQRKEYDKKRYAANRNKKKQQVADNYKKNSAKIKEYNRSYRRLKKNLNLNEQMQNRLDERKIDPTKQELEWMEKQLKSHCIKYNNNCEDLRSIAYIALVIALRTQKYEEWFNIELHIKSIVKLKLMQYFTKSIKKENKKYTLSLYECNAEGTELINMIQDKNASINFDIKEDVEYFIKLIKQGFISRGKYKYKGKYYDIWYDKHINKLSLKDLQEKYDIDTYKSIESLLTKIKKMFKEIQKKIVDDNPDTY